MSHAFPELDPGDCWQVILDNLHRCQDHTYEEIEAVITTAATAGWDAISDSLDAQLGDVTTADVVTAALASLAASAAEAVAAQVVEYDGEKGTAHTEAVQAWMRTVGVTMLGAVLAAADEYGDRQAAQN